MWVVERPNISALAAVAGFVPRKGHSDHRTSLSRRHRDAERQANGAGALWLCASVRENDGRLVLALEPWGPRAARRSWGCGLQPLRSNEVDRRCAMAQQRNRVRNCVRLILARSCTFPDGNIRICGTGPLFVVAIIVLAAMQVAFGAALEAPDVHKPVFPLKLSGDQRYLVDQQETPFLVIGDSPTNTLMIGRREDSTRCWST